MGDVISIKSGKSIFPKKPVEAVEEELNDDGIEEDIDDLVNITINHFKEWFEKCDIASADEAYYRDMHHLKESVGALIYRAFGVPHPLQEAIDDMISQRSEEDGSITTYWVVPEED